MSTGAPTRAGAQDAAPAIIDVNVEIGPTLTLDADATIRDVLSLASTAGTGPMLVRHRASRTISRALGNRLALEAASVDARFVPVATATTVAVERLDRELGELVRAGARAVWVEGRDSWALGTEVAREMLVAAARTSVPLLIPCRVFGDASAIGRLTEPLGVNVILVGVHYMNYADIFAALRRYTHLHVETSSIASYQGIEEFVRIAGAERVLFGSAMPLRTPLAPINAVVASRSPDASKRKILHDNAARLFGVASRSLALPRARRPARAFDVHGHFFPAPWEVPQPRDDEILPEVTRHGIRIRIASAVPALLGDLERGNAQTVAACGSVPGQLGYLVADANDLDGSRATIKRWGDARGIVGAKVHCVLSGQRTGSSAMAALFEELADYGRPVKIHVDGDDWPAAVKALAAAHPRLPIIVAHGGPGRPLARLANVLTTTENVYVELASSVGELPELRSLVGSIDRRKLLFGTDAPLLDPAFAIGTYESLGLRPEELSAAFWDNAVSLFEHHGLS